MDKFYKNTWNQC